MRRASKTHFRHRVGPGTAKFELPAEVVEVLALSDTLATRSRGQVVLELLRERVISKGKAVELLGVDFDGLRALMDETDIPWFDYAPGELEDSLRVLDRVSRQVPTEASGCRWGFHRAA